jgi:hypothetical protein
VVGNSSEHKVPKGTALLAGGWLWLTIEVEYPLMVGDRAVSQNLANGTSFRALTTAVTVFGSRLTVLGWSRTKLVTANHTVVGPHCEVNSLRR